MAVHRSSPQTVSERLPRRPRRTIVGTLVAIIVLGLVVAQVRHHSTAAAITNPVESASARFLNALHAAVSPVARNPNESQSCLNAHCSLSSGLTATRTLRQSTWRFSDAVLAHPPRSLTSTSGEILKSRVASRVISQRNNDVFSRVSAPGNYRVTLLRADEQVRREASALRNPTVTCQKAPCTIIAASGAVVTSFAFERVATRTASIDVVVSSFLQSALLDANGHFGHWVVSRETQNGRLNLQRVDGHWIVKRLRLAHVSGQL